MEQDLGLTPRTAIRTGARLSPNTQHATHRRPALYPRPLIQQAERLKASGVPLPVDLYLALQDESIDAKQYAFQMRG